MYIFFRLTDASDFLEISLLFLFQQLLAMFDDLHYYLLHLRINLKNEEMSLYEEKRLINFTPLYLQKMVKLIKVSFE